MTKIKLTPGEERLAINYVAGMTDIDSYNDAYPGVNLDDTQKRYKHKQILKRPHVQAFIKQLQITGEVNEQMTADSVKAMAWRTAQKHEGTNIGIKALALCGKWTGLDVQKIEVVDERRFDEMLLQLSDYADAIARGDEVAPPPCLMDQSDVIETIDFEVVENDYEEDTDE